MQKKKCESKINGQRKVKRQRNKIHRENIKIHKRSEVKQYLHI